MKISLLHSQAQHPYPPLKANSDIVDAIDAQLFRGQLHPTRKEEVPTGPRPALTLI